VTSLSQRPLREKSLIVLALVCTIIASLWVFPFWGASPELSHGFAAPILSLWLIVGSRDEPSLPIGKATRTILLGALGVLSTLTGLLAAFSTLSLGVLHAQPVFLGVYSWALLLVCIVVALDANPSKLVHLNGRSLVGVALWLCAAPLGPLEWLTLALRNLTTNWMLDSLVFLGIPAEKHGNTIGFGSQFVGIEDACSGIRSLLACIFAGFFLGGMMLRGIWPRLLLAGSGALLAIVANYFRSSFLCLLVYNDVDIAGRWHDLTAYAVLGLTVVTLFGLAKLLARMPSHTEPKTHEEDVSLWALQAPLYAGFILLALAILVAWRTQPDQHRSQHSPNLKALAVIDVPGWHRRDNPHIERYASSLGTPFLFETHYFRKGADLSFYLAYWPAGVSTLGIVGLHRPDVCLPNSGWIQKELPPGLKEYPLGPILRYAYEFEGEIHHLWFWHFSGSQVVDQLPGLRPWQIGPYILRRPGSARAEQWIIRVSSSRPVEELKDDPLLLTFFDRLKSVGLEDPRIRKEGRP